MLITLEGLKNALKSISSILNAKADRVEMVQSDYIEQNKDNNAYIKNRPFYVTKEQEIKVINLPELSPQQSVTLTGEQTEIIHQLYLEMKDANISAYNPYNSNNYIIKENGNIVTLYYINCSAMYLLSDDFSFYCDFSYTSESSFYNSSDNIINVSITYIESEQVKAIDDKYLPSDIVRTEVYNAGKKYDNDNLIPSEIFNDYDNNNASGNGSHAEGSRTSASGLYAHAEGYYTEANGNYGSHAEGYFTDASGTYGSHAEGYSTSAAGLYAHAEGYYTTAQGNNQHVEGKFNRLDTSSTYAHIIGNGTSMSNRSNAYTLDWGGNGIYAGKVTVGAAPTSNMDVATKQYVDDAINDVPILPTSVSAFNNDAGYLTLGEASVTLDLGTMSAIPHTFTEAEAEIFYNQLVSALDSNDNVTRNVLVKLYEDELIGATTNSYFSCVVTVTRLAIPNVVYSFNVSFCNAFTDNSFSEYNLSLNLADSYTAMLTKSKLNPHIVDAGNYFVSNTTEGALQEVGARLNPPTSDGVYKLRCVITGGVPTFGWEVDT